MNYQPFTLDLSSFDHPLHPLAIAISAVRGDYENVSHDDLEPQLYDRQWRWLPAAGLGGAMLLAAVLVEARPKFGRAWERSRCSYGWFLDVSW
eukprot:Skav223544  [mRNA]  locus=scaffold1657:45385:45663:- [translate_table: standard]